MKIRMKRFVKKISLVGLVAFCYLSICFAQGNPNNPYSVESEILSEENSAVSSKNIEIVKYRLELIKLPEPPEFQKSEPRLEKAFRLVVTTAKPLPYDHYSIWLDESQYRASRVKPNELAIIIYAKTLPSGVTEMAVSKQSETDLDSLLMLPGKLQVPFEYATPLDEIAANAPVITLRRLQGRDRVLIELTVNIPGVPCEIKNFVEFIALDEKMYGESSCKDNAFGYLITAEQFGQIRNGAEIVLKGGGGFIRTLRKLGRLNKDLIE